MTIGKQLPAPTMEIPGDNTKIILWEGEWPQLKRVVKSTRLFASCISYHVNSVFDFGAAKSSLIDTAKKVDTVAVSRSKQLGRTYRENPWIVPATGIAGVSTFVFLKSARWGMLASVRHSLLCAGILVGLTFPHEIRRAISNAVYRDAPMASIDDGAAIVERVSDAVAPVERK